MSNNIGPQPDITGLTIVVERDGATLRVPATDLPDFCFLSGDTLTLDPSDIGSRLHRTPDQNVHLAIGTKRIRLPLNYVMTEANGLSFPEHLVVLTGAGTATLDLFGELHIANYRKHMGLSPQMEILELGCGIGRDALQFEKTMSPQGRYVGIDVTWDSINWCRKNITSRSPNFQFHHVDAVHELYNPLGQQTSMDFRIPCANASIDRVCAGSVFTHLFEDEIVHYMRELKRVLKEDGLIYATFFLYSDATIEAARRTNLTHNNLMFRHPFADGCYVNDPGYPTGAVAFTEEAMMRMIAKSGLRLNRPFLNGAWSGAFQEAEDGQEVAILSL